MKPPSRATFLQRNYFAIMTPLTLGVAIYFYTATPDPDVQVYWKQLQAGHVPMEYGVPDSISDENGSIPDAAYVVPEDEEDEWDDEE
jgi:hypothetical protein